MGSGGPQISSPTKPSLPLQVGVLSTKKPSRLPPSQMWSGVYPPLAPSPQCPVSAAINPPEPWLDLSEFEDTCYYVPWRRSYVFRRAVELAAQILARKPKPVRGLPVAPEADPQAAPKRIVIFRAGMMPSKPAAHPKLERTATKPTDVRCAARCCRPRPRAIRASAGERQVVRPVSRARQRP